jgi:GT2 family glycosyltransferase/glycosyltransferase involved in cell wall biosynthesis
MTEPANLQTEIQVSWSPVEQSCPSPSATVVFPADSQPHRCLVQIPPGTGGGLRLDAGSGHAYWRIEYLKLYAGLESLNEGHELAAWSSQNGFEGLLVGPGICLVRSGETFDFICLDDHPQLFIPLPVQRENEKLLFLEMLVGVTNLDGQAKELAAHVAALQDALTRAEYASAGYLKEIDSLRQATTALEARVLQQESHRAQLESSFEDERKQLWQGLREREIELRKIASTLSWAFSNSVGKVRRKYLAPALRAAGVSSLPPEKPLAEISSDHAAIIRRPALRTWLSGVLDVALRRKAMIDLVPGGEVRRIESRNAWMATGEDPQFELAGPLPIGWVLFTVRVDAIKSVVGARSMLYVDEGCGYSEDDRYDLGPTGKVNKFYLNVGPEVDRIRLDPIDTKGEFAIKKFSVRRVTRLEAELRHKELLSLNRDGGGVEPDPPASFEIPKAVAPYDAWLEVNQWNPRRESILRDRLLEMSRRPLLSIIMPVFNPPIELLERAIASIVGQVYDNWELCIADDCSTNPDVTSVLREWAARDSRIRLAFRPQNGGISLATNSAALIATGEFLAFVDNDDEIPPDALGEIALYVDRHPQTDILYSDCDKIDAAGRRYNPEFKPDWSPELLLSYMYLDHFVVIRADLYQGLGGEREGFEGAQDYDLALRASEKARHVGHIPKVLYHWRALPGSTASSGDAKPASFEAGRKAVQEALARRSIAATAFQPEWAVQARCGIFADKFPDDGPTVTIVIPTKNNHALLRKCVESIRKTSYRRCQVLIADNESDDSETLGYLKTCGHRIVRIPNKDSAFSFAYINNSVARQVDSDLLLFLNDDTEVLSTDWLSQLVGYMAMSGVGAVGARLVFPNGLIQHAGVVHGYYNGMAGPAFKLLPASDHGYLAYASVARNCSAVTAACMLTRRGLFLEMGGFDEQVFAVAYNDVDYCHRLTAGGYRVVYCPTAELIHHEGSTRGFIDSAAERAAYRTKYRDFTDVYYNPNLSLADERFHIDPRTLPGQGKRPIRVLMAGVTLNWEGAPYDQLEMTVGLKDAGVIEPIVYCPLEGPLRRQYEEKGIEVRVFPHPLLSVLNNMEGYRLGISAFARWIETLGVELVYGNTLQTFYAIAAARELGLPSIWNPRESEPWQTYFKAFGDYVSARGLDCFGYPYKVIFTAKASQDVYQALNARHNFMMIHDGLDRETFEASLAKWTRSNAREKLGLSDAQVMILMVGTVCERKRQLDLIAAVARLTEKQTEIVTCFIVGDRPGDYSDELKKAREGLSRRRRESVTIVGECEDVALYYRAADVYVCASEYESFPRVILEAMAAGLPIVATPAYGVVEQVREGSNAFFFKTGDAAGLADKISRLAADPGLRQEMGANSPLELDTIIDYKSMVREYAKVFQEAWLSGRPRASDPRS